MKTWQEVLKSIGYPATVLVIDFESYFDSKYSLTNMSGLEYINDDRFSFTGVGIGICDGTEPLDTDFVNAPIVDDRIRNLFTYKFGKNYERATVVMQNAQFDATILRDVFGIQCPYLIDTKDLARHLEPRASARLEDMAERYGLSAKGDTMQFKGLHYSDMTLEQIVALREYTCQDVNLEFELFTIMLPLINNPAIEIQLMHNTLNLYLKSPIKFNFKLAGELVHDMGQLLQGKIDLTGHTLKELTGNLSFVEILQDALPSGENVPVKVAKRPGKNMTKLLGRAGVGPALAKDDEGCKSLLVHRDESVRNLIDARLGAKSWPSHIKRVQRMSNMARANNGILPVPSAYYGCHTGRWAGTGGINLLNLGSKSHILINKVRNLLTAPPGYTFVIQDWSQIEARFLAWMAGQDDLVQDFADGKDIYSIFASDLFKTRVRKAREDDPEAIKAFLTPKRNMGKDTILGGGYGMAWAKFFTRMQANDSLREMIIAGVYTKATAKKAIDGYRKKYNKIPKFWAELERGFKWVIRCPRDATRDLPKGFSFSSIGRTVTLNFPTGSKMIYHE